MQAQTHADKVKNPWLDLPKDAPYIAPIDIATISDPSYKKDHYRFDAFPDPFVGNFDTAKVVFLSLNPGFKDEDVEVNLNSDIFMQESLKSIRRESDARFFYWLPELSETHGQQWWKLYLGKTIREQGITVDRLLNNMMQIEYLAYHSKNYIRNKATLPTQEYSLDLIRDTMAHNKIIVLMRSVKDWYKIIPELEVYQHLITLDNTQRPYISESNMKNAPAGSYQRVVAALKS